MFHGVPVNKTIISISQKATHITLLLFPFFFFFLLNATVRAVHFFFFKKKSHSQKFYLIFHFPPSISSFNTKNKTNHLSEGSPSSTSSFLKNISIIAIILIFFFQKTKQNKTTEDKLNPSAADPAERRKGIKSWDKWVQIGGVMTSHAAVGRAADGSLEVFFRGADNTLFRAAQKGPNSREFYPIDRVGSPDFRFEAHPVVATQDDGSLVVFAYSVSNSSLHVLSQSSKPTASAPGLYPLEWTTLGGRWRGVPAVGKQKDGTLSVFTRSEHGYLFTCRQKAPSSPLWHLWHDIGGKLLGDPAVGYNADKTLQIYARFTDNRLWGLLQEAPDMNKWKEWHTLGGEITTDPTVLQREDGTQEVFARWTDNRAYHLWQTAPNSQTWSPWYSLGGALNSPLSVVLRNSLIELYGVGNDNTVLFKKQALHIDWEWTDWVSHTGRLVGNPVVIVNNKGRLEAFIRGAGNSLYHAWQLSLVNTEKWSAWVNRGGQLMSDPTVVSQKDGTLAVFVTGYDNALWTAVQTKIDDPNSWTKVTRLGGHLIGQPAVVKAQDGRLAVFARGIDNSLAHIVQVSVLTGGYMWSDWVSLGGKLEDEPVAEVDGWGAIHVFVRGSGNSLRYLRQDNSEAAKAKKVEVWDSWMEITGLTITTQPVISKNSAGNLAVFVLDTDHRLHVSSQEDVRAWSTWELVGDKTQSATLSWFSRPAVTLDARGRFMIIAKGGDSKLYGCSLVGGEKKWSPWSAIDGQVVAGDPVAASYPSGLMVILGRGVSNDLWAKQYGKYVTDSAQDWSPWVSLGGRLAS